MISHAPGITGAAIGAAMVLVVIILNWRLPPTTSSGIHVPGYAYATAEPLDGWSDFRLRRQLGESDWNLAARLNRQVFESFYHCNYRETSRLIDDFAVMPISDAFNQVGLLLPENLCGYCHQASYILARALTDNGISAWPIGLNGHVVTLVDLGNRRWILDPDFGLGPFQYKDAMWKDVEGFYKAAARGDQPYLQEYAKAYKTIKDDQPYYSLIWLNNTEKIQRRWILAAEILSYVIGCFGLAIFFWCSIVRKIFAACNHRGTIHADPGDSAA